MMPPAPVRLSEHLTRAWLGRGPLALALLPVSGLYALAVALRRTLYALAWRRAQRLPVPVIVVGNVVAGGAGKTPVTIALVRHLQARGITAGVISRGYGRSDRSCREVFAHDDPTLTGDEPLLIRQACEAPVFVAPRRAQAGAALLAAHPGVQVLVCDDGLQHLALARDIEICVFDARGTGNGWLMPAGPLREHWPRPVDLALAPPAAGIADSHSLTRSLAAIARQADGSQRPLALLAVSPVHAVAAIAQPQAFFDMLREQGIRLASATALPDHADPGTATLPADAPLLCTAKDAVKLWQRRPDAWCVDLEIRCDDAFWHALDVLVDRALSSRHGPTPA